MSRTVTPSLAIDTEHDKGTQTSRGFWIDEFSVASHHRSNPSSLDDSFESDRTQKQVSLIGCVNIQRRDLIPDGRGGYFVHITKREIQRNEPYPLHREQRSNPRKRPSQQNDPYTQPAPYFNMPPPMYQNGPFPNASYMQRPHSGPNPMYMHNSLPLSSNNLSEDLLRMQNAPMRNNRPQGKRPF